MSGIVIEHPPESLQSFVRENSNFLLSSFAMIGFCISGFFIFILKSRCSVVKCGCIHCERKVISEENINDIVLHKFNPVGVENV